MLRTRSMGYMGQILGWIELRFRVPAATARAPFSAWRCCSCHLLPRFSSATSCLVNHCQLPHGFHLFFSSLSRPRQAGLRCGAVSTRAPAASLSVVAVATRHLSFSLARTGMVGKGFTGSGFEGFGESEGGREHRTGVANEGVGEGNVTG